MCNPLVFYALAPRAQRLIFQIVPLMRAKVPNTPDNQEHDVS
jgi:hypothetical protein